MSKKVTMLKVWYYPDIFTRASSMIHETLIRPEEFEDFRKSVYSILKVKRKKIKIN